MKYLERIWVRGLISFFGGGVIPEIIFISTGDPNRPRNNSTNMMTLFCVVLIYFTLTYFVKNKKKNKL